MLWKIAMHLRPRLIFTGVIASGYIMDLAEKFLNFP